MSRLGFAARSWWVGGIAGLGVVASHWLTYRLLHLEGHLHETGHGHLGTTSALAVALFVAGTARFCVTGLRGRSPLGFGAVALRLTLVQAVVWLGMETTERAAAGALATLDDNAVVLVGLLVQVAVALVGAALVRLGARVLEAVVARRRSAVHRRRLPQPVLRDRVPHAVHAWGGQGVRGPPTAPAVDAI